MKMEIMFNAYLHLGVIIALTSLVLHIHAQSQSDFISIDCGMPIDTRYVETTTGVEYVSDLGFIDSNVGFPNYTSYSDYPVYEGDQFYTVRSFPDGVRNCYTLKPTQGKASKYLIRARFFHGSYDGALGVPEFDLYLGANKWDTVKLKSIDTITTMEIIHIPSSDNIFVCLVNTGLGTPFISTLELRPLKSLTYSTSQLILFQRFDMGSKSNKTIRYKDDAYDRIWEPFIPENNKEVRTSLIVFPNSTYETPSRVMANAATPSNESNSLKITFRPNDPTKQFFVYIHLAEIEKLGVNETREFDIYENGVHWQGPISPYYLDTTTFASFDPVRGDEITYELVKTRASTLPPILNALELYSIHNFTEPETDEQDVDTMMKIKAKYGLRKNWQGDPCSPKNFMWVGLNCSFDDPDPLRVISLNLSSSSLTGQISSYISDLTMLQYLDLSNNNLTGPVPNFLSKLQFLKALDLRGNQLAGSVPVDLIERSNSGSILLNVSGNPDLKSDFGICSSTLCQNKKHKSNIVAVIASTVTVLIVIVLVIIGWTLIKRRTKARKAERPKLMRKLGSALELKNHQFTYSEIIGITNDFEKVVGKGGFGTVYHGYLNGTQVAVKMLSEKSAQGYKEFQAEVKLLMRVHHVNLTSLIGYCYEDNYMGLIYEYMANGNLGRHLSDKSEYTLSWEDRMRIAVDAAQGLEYLHHGCKPSIVHRDVKTANILLNEKFQAKIADFGLSRAFSIEGDTQLSTAVAGTPGYLDPEYFQNNLLNDKSDVYSFGVVLLEIVTSRPVFIRSGDLRVTSHLSRWVSSVLGGDVNNVVDPKLQGNFDTKSAWKAVELAIACLRQSSSERPTMSEVVTELKECLAIEISLKKDGRSEADSFGGNVDSNVYTDLYSLPR